MSDEDVAEAVGHTVAIGLATKSKLFLVVHDAVVQWAGWLEGDLAPQLPAKMLGRGGTAFEPAYARIAEEHAQFDIMIHLTDGGVGTWPARPPNVQRGIVALLGWMDRHALPPDQEAIDAKL
jgi:predicted metal-dependent peptidase